MLLLQLKNSLPDCWKRATETWTSIRVDIQWLDLKSSRNLHSFVFIIATTKCTKSILYCYKYKKYQSYLLLLQLQEVKGKSNIQEIIRHRLYLTIIMNVYINGPLWLPRQQDYIFDRSLQQAKMYFLFSNRHREENRGLNHYEFPG